jgi:hypothetical protein
MVLSAALVFGAYEWGRVEWGARTGAALAIGSFVMAAIAWFTWLAVLVRRDARRDRERREGPDHIPGRG